jgi:hypothetical protein
VFVPNAAHAADYAIKNLIVIVIVAVVEIVIVILMVFWRRLTTAPPIDAGFVGMIRTHFPFAHDHLLY